MNTVLLATAPDSSATPKSKVSRSTPDSTPTDDAAGFAGVLANQSTTQGKSTVAAASSSDTPVGVVRTASKRPDATIQGTPQSALHNDANQDTDNAKSQSLARLNSTELVNGRHVDGHGSLTTGSSVATPERAGHDKASLPEQFSRIIAAMQQSRHSAQSQPDEASVNAEKPAAASDVAEQAATRTINPVTSPDRTTATILKPAPDDRGMSADKAGVAVRNAALAEHAAAAVPSRFDAVSLADDSSHNLTASQASASLLGNGPAAEAPLSPALAAGPAFSLTPGLTQSSDIAATAATVNQPLFSKQWGPELGRQFISLIRPGANGSHVAELRLDPPELGPLRITININDSVVQAMFTSTHASVRSAVEQALPQLQQQLEQEGLSLGQANVDHDDGRHHAGAETSTNAKVAAGRNDTDVSLMGATVHRRVPDALVDTFA